MSSMDRGYRFWNVRLIVQCYAPRTVTCHVYGRVSERDCRTAITRTFWQPSKGKKKTESRSTGTLNHRSRHLYMTLPEMLRQLHERWRVFRVVVTSQWTRLFRFGAITTPRRRTLTRDASFFSVISTASLRELCFCSQWGEGNACVRACVHACVR